MQGSKVGVGVIGLVLGLVACAAPMTESSREPSLTRPEIARLQDLKDAAERTRVAYGAGCLAKPCIPRFAITEELEAPARWDGPSFRIWLRRQALAPGAEPRPAVAHELSHWLLGHSASECAASHFDCETEANAEAVHVLVVGWGVSQEYAVSLMYRSLLIGLQRNGPIRGHEKPCHELTVFARAFQQPEPACDRP